MKNKNWWISLIILIIFLTPQLTLAQWSVDDLGATNLPDPVGGVFGIIENILYWLLALLGILGVIGFAIAGILYLTAAGDDDQAKKAKNAMMYSIIGIIVGLMGLIIVRAIDSALRGYSFF